MVVKMMLYNKTLICVISTSETYDRGK